MDSNKKFNPTSMDDTQSRISIVSPVCSFCKHFNQKSILGQRKTCKAFPKGLPAEIWLGENKHQEPFPGDNGIRFEQIPGTKMKEG